MSHGIEGEFIAPIITAGTPIILGAFAGIAALFRLWLSRYEKRQNARLDTIVHQVQNSHTINLRDDLDEKFADVVQRVDRISETLDHVVMIAVGLVFTTRRLRALFLG